MRYNQTINSNLDSRRNSTPIYDIKRWVSNSVTHRTSNIYMLFGKYLFQHNEHNTKQLKMFSSHVGVLIKKNHLNKQYLNLIKYPISYTQIHLLHVVSILSNNLIN